MPRYNTDATLYSCINCGTEIYVQNGESFTKHKDYCGCRAGMIAKLSSGNNSSNEDKLPNLGNEPKRRYKLGKVNRPKRRLKK